jgi:hypothetical protein
MVLNGVASQPNTFTQGQLAGSNAETPLLQADLDVAQNAMFHFLSPRPRMLNVRCLIPCVFPTFHDMVPVEQLSDGPSFAPNQRRNFRILIVDKLLDHLIANVPLAELNKDGAFERLGRMLHRPAETPTFEVVMDLEVHDLGRVSQEMYEAAKAFA